MRQIKLPYRKVVQWFLLFFSAPPLAVYIEEYFFGKRKEALSWGILFWAFLTAVAAIGFLPFFKFKSDDKRASNKALLKIPILEMYLLMPTIIFAFFVFGGLNLIFDGAYQQGFNMLKFGLPGLFLILLAVNSHRIWFKDELIPDIVAKETEFRRADVGRFSYTDTGFAHADRYKSATYDWAEVNLIMAYKSDSFAYDTIHLVLGADNKTEFHIHEGTPGWFIFKDKLSSNLPGIDLLWEMKVMFPPFEESVTLVYERGKDLMADWGNRK